MRCSGTGIPAKRTPGTLGPMTRNEAAHILARSLLDAGYTRNQAKHRSGTPRWLSPDGYPATRCDLAAHICETYHGDDRDPFLDFLRPGGDHWPLVDKAARPIPASP